MYYDPIKQLLGRLFNRWLFSRRLFYHLLDILLLRTWHIHKQLRQFYRENKGTAETSILDAGSGFGQYSFYMARKNPLWTVTGIDLKKEEIEACNQFFSRLKVKNARFYEADLLTYVKPDSFDLILSVDVMEHIEEDLVVFRNLCNSLKPGGILLVNTPSDKGGSGVHAAGDTSFIEEHVREGYGPAEIDQKLRQAGFSKTHIQYTYGLPGNISWHLSMKIPISLLNVSRVFLIILPVYYILVMPFALILNFLDLHIQHKSGTGLLVKAWK